MSMAMPPQREPSGDVACICRHSRGAHFVRPGGCAFCDCERFQDPSSGSVEVATEVREALRIAAQDPVFRGIRPDHLDTIGQFGSRHRFLEGTVLIQEGENADSVYLILAGLVKVERGADSANPLLLAQLGRGQFVGEIGVVRRIPRTATVTALEDLQVLELTVDEIHQAFHQDHDLVLAFARLVNQRMAKMEGSRA
jgi:signal-transduction protein with cAMP-binding, CBS, and nucleotidyltransferase domain